MNEGGSTAPIEPIVFDPSQVTADWALNVTQKLLAASYVGVTEVQELLPSTVVQSIFEALCSVVVKEPTVVDVQPDTADAAVVVVGDTHGQLHDVCAMLQQVGQPSEKQLYIFNGDFVDRGAWGLEVLLMLACWKLVHPKHVTILRGNHECTTCTHMYGFRAEVLAKYGQKVFKDVFKVCKKLFAALPLAAVVAGKTLVLHGGLFRKPSSSTNRRKKRRKSNYPLEIGSMEDLRAATKGGLDPNGAGKAVVATDVMWSDPAAEPGLVENDARGVGLLFGPDVTQAFLEANHLKLIIRSHEGPDARWKREGMQDMSKGHSLDHVTPEGNLMTVFSAPDYPQFQPNDNDRFNNLAAVAVLRNSQGDYTQPELVEYSAAPRPPAKAFYEYEDVPDSDEEMSIGHGSASDVSEASSQGASALSHTTVDNDTAEASSSVHGPEAQHEHNQSENDAQGGADGDSSTVNGAVQLQAKGQLDELSAAADLNGVSEAKHLNGHSQLGSADTELKPQLLRSHSEDKMPQTNEGTSPVAQQQQQPEQSLHQSASPADPSCGKHQTAAVFDPEVAKEAAAVDQEAGATVEEADAPGCGAELPQISKANQLVTSNEQPTAPPASDASSLASIAAIRSQPLRSSSRQSQAKSAPWR